MNQIVIEASPFIDVKATSEAAKELYNSPFEIRKLANLLGYEKPKKLYGFWESDNAYLDRLNKWETAENDVLFEGLSCKDMFHYQEVTIISTSTIITFETNLYEINHLGKKFLFPVLPDTIDDFINDLKRIGIVLFWKQKIADFYGIDSVTSNKKIIDYYTLVKNLNKKIED